MALRPRHYSTNTTNKYQFPVKTIRGILNNPQFDTDRITVNGWVRSVRSQKHVAFLQLDDGSCIQGLQATTDNPTLFEKYTCTSWFMLQMYIEYRFGSIHTGCSVSIHGKLVPLNGREQSSELHVDSVQVLGQSNPDVSRMV
jgi:asparaginyl-tRNA synthetase